MSANESKGGWPRFREVCLCFLFSLFFYSLFYVQYVFYSVFCFVFCLFSFVICFQKPLSSTSFDQEYYITCLHYISVIRGNALQIAVARNQTDIDIHRANLQGTYSCSALRYVMYVQ